MKATRILIVCTFLFLPGILIAAEHTTVRFDGTWHTHVDCPARGNMEAFAWKFDSVIINGELRGVRGTEGEPGSFVLTGKINAMASCCRERMPAACSLTKARNTTGTSGPNSRTLTGPAPEMKGWTSSVVPALLNSKSNWMFRQRPPLLQRQLHRLASEIVDWPLNQNLPPRFVFCLVLTMAFN